MPPTSLDWWVCYIHCVRRTDIAATRHFFRLRKSASRTQQKSRLEANGSTITHNELQNLQRLAAYEAWHHDRKSNLCTSSDEAVLASLWNELFVVLRHVTFCTFAKCGYIPFSVISFVIFSSFSLFKGCSVIALEPCCLAISVVCCTTFLSNKWLIVWLIFIYFTASPYLQM